ncbi:tyrosine-type recombinase/integrase [Phyllobacterium lublinensis]|uniref:tyrosine-type recombinase/integrase n=1 Tax=Phyllobacterium lublinensis TaxID=2875708 RepID=UPI001CCD16CB|nr:tyrosine-type recombinase/integrase [Phyllobacterium sp. 2063]MBZ9654684.1 site-specific integrase [Phyllobacterium sp. 2063]
MSRTLKEAPLTTGNARKALGKGIHWRSLDEEVHLGYRKGVRGGAWIVRWYKGNQQYQQEAFAIADDVFEADDDRILTFYQASRIALALADHRKIRARIAEVGPPVTIQDAVDRYITAKETELAQKGVEDNTGDTRRRLTKHVLSKKELVEKPLYFLTENDLRKWQDTAGVSRSTLKRIIGNFKAALNAAAKTHRATLPPEINTIIKHGLALSDTAAPIARHGQALSQDVIQKIVNASLIVDSEDGWEGDLHRIIVVLAATGGRFSQIARLKVSDIQTEKKRAMVPVSRKGRGVKSRTHVRFPIDDEISTILLPAVSGRRGDGYLLERWYSVEVPRVEGKRNWTRVKRGRWTHSSQLAQSWARILEVAKLETSIVPYAFRHSSIVRMLRQHLPVSLVAELHDTSVATIEKHYAAEISDALDDMVALAALPLTSEPSKVERLKVEKRA